MTGNVLIHRKTKQQTNQPINEPLDAHINVKNKLLYFFQPYRFQKMDYRPNYSNEDFN